MFGLILGGAAHGCMSGMISSRHEGATLAELSGTCLGIVVKWMMRILRSYCRRCAAVLLFAVYAVDSIRNKDKKLLR